MRAVQLISITLLTLALGLSTASADTIRVGKVVDVSADFQTNNEVPMAMNPANPLNLVAAWNDWNLNEGVGYAFSLDGGLSWSKIGCSTNFLPGITKTDDCGRVVNPTGFDFAGDPGLAFAASGRLYAAVQAFNGGGSKAIAMYVLRSDDGGRTWGPKVLVSKGTGVGNTRGSNGQFPDHEAIWVDNSPTSPFFGSVYVAWAQFNGAQRSPIQLAFSRDGGRTFSFPLTLSMHGNTFAQDAWLFTDARGNVYVSFDATGGNNGNAPLNIVLAVSTDGGRSVAANFVISQFVHPIPGLLPNTGYRVFSYPVSGFNFATRQIDIVWSDMRSGHADVWATHNIGGSLSAWTAPVRVNTSSRNEHFFPALSIAPDGRLDILFYDRSFDPHDRLNWPVYARSLDGGATWTNALLWTTPFNGDAQTANGFDFIGDYLGIASNNSVVHPAWVGNGPLAGSTPQFNQDIFTATVFP